jgi:hypothetical protein
LPLQRVEPGVHEPEHAPLTHAWLLQATDVPQAPLDEQVCTPLPEHRVAFGVQTPVHPPDTQA